MLFERKFFLQNIMKKTILTFTFMSLLMIGGDVFAQGRATDGFFESNYEQYRAENDSWGKMPLLPRTHGYEFDYSAEDKEGTATPIGSGVLLLGAMSVGYLAFRKKD